MLSDMPVTNSLYLEVGLKIREEIHVSGRMDSDILLLKDECLQVGTTKTKCSFIFKTGD